MLRSPAINIEKQQGAVVKSSPLLLDGNFYEKNSEPYEGNFSCRIFLAISVREMIISFSKLEIIIRLTRSDDIAKKSNDYFCSEENNSIL